MAEDKDKQAPPAPKAQANSILPGLSQADLDFIKAQEAEAEKAKQAAKTEGERQKEVRAAIRAKYKLPAGAQSVYPDGDQALYFEVAREVHKIEPMNNTGFRPILHLPADD